jgi:hypothetical protein
MPWYLAVFAVITTYLAIANTLLALTTGNTKEWTAIQYVVTGELIRAGAAALVISPIIVETGRMVLAAIWSERRERKAREEGRHFQQAEWEAWNRRRQEAGDQGVPFNEPPPELENQPEPRR